MSSSPSTPQYSTCSIPPQPRPYRRIDYYDGGNVCVTESRRGTQVASSSSSSSTSSRRSYSPASDVSQATSSIRSTSPPVSGSRPVSSARAPRSDDHVIHKLRRSKVKVAIIQASIQSGCKQREMTSQAQNAELLTPPPTPKIERLPSPELDDLEDRPFCNCCIEAHAVKYCASCGHRLTSVMH